MKVYPYAVDINLIGYIKHLHVYTNQTIHINDIHATRICIRSHSNIGLNWLFLK
jgi:hypothetical protein